MSYKRALKQVSASDAKNYFGGLLDDVVELGAVEIVKHGRPVAVVLSARAFRDQQAAHAAGGGERARANDMIPLELARRARIISAGDGFDDD